MSGSAAARAAQIASRLEDIATVVADEATGLTLTVRAVGDHARQIAELAAELEGTAGEIEDRLRRQRDLLADARERVGGNAPALAALSDSTRTIAEMSAAIGQVAGRSRLLALNARIEASRTGAAGHGFAAVAEEMSTVAHQTRGAATDIADRAAQVGVHLQAARATIVDGIDLLDREHGAVTDITREVTVQRGRVGDVARLTAETVERVDAAAVAIGRVSSAATTVRLLARQMKRDAPQPAS